MTPDEIIENGIWHFMTQTRAEEALAVGHIIPSQRSNKPRDNHARHLGAVAVFDLSRKDSATVSAQDIEMQVSNCAGYLRGLKPLAFGIELDPTISTKLVGPAYVDGYTIDAVEEDNIRYLPRAIPYFERWHCGAISFEYIRRVLVWGWQSVRSGPWQTEEWTHGHEFPTLEEAAKFGRT